MLKRILIIDDDIHYIDILKALIYKHAKIMNLTVTIDSCVSYGEARKIINEIKEKKREMYNMFIIDLKLPDVQDSRNINDSYGIALVTLITGEFKHAIVFVITRFFHKIEDLEESVVMDFYKIDKKNIYDKRNKINIAEEVVSTIGKLAG